MQTVKAYRVYFDNGIFVPYEPVAIPEGSQAIVAILDFPVENAQEHGEMDDVSRRQMEAMRRFREGLRECNEPVPDFERVKFRETDI